MRALGSHRALGVALAVALLLAGAAQAKDEEPPAPVGCQVAELPGVRVVERVIDGRFVAAAVLPESIGRGLAVLLARDASTRDDGSVVTIVIGGDADAEIENLKDDEGDQEMPRELWAVFADPATPPRLLVGGLPKTLEDLELHRGSAGPDGALSIDELWLGGDGVVYRHDPGTETAVSILAAPGLDLGVLEQTGLLNIGGGVAVPELGRLRLLDAQMRETAVLPLPVTAERRSSGLILSSPHVVRPRADAMPYFLGPESQGGTRLLVRVLDPAATAVAEESTGAAGADPKETDSNEAWIRLPAPEDVERSKYIVLDSVPRLAITTTDAERLGIFEEMGFRLYALRPDRTRAGTGPILNVQTETKQWYPVGIEVADLNRDGKDDLALLQPEGMGGGDLVVDVYLGLGDGRVAVGGRRRSKIDGGGEAHWGHDLTGDGVPDLFVAGHERVQAFAGDKDHRTRAVAKKAAWGWQPEELRVAMRRLDGEDGPMPAGHYSSLGAIRVHDLDGDGAMDLSLAKGQKGRVVVRFVVPNR